MKGALQEDQNMYDTLIKNATNTIMSIVTASGKLPEEAKNHLKNSIANAQKVIATLDIMTDLEIIDPEEFQDLKDDYTGTIIQLKGFIRALGSKK